MSARKDVRIALMGSVDAGKTTFLGVISSGKTNDAKESARNWILANKHEIQKGKTSTVTKHVMGYKLINSVAETQTQETKSVCRNFEPIFNTAAVHASSFQRGRSIQSMMEEADHLIDFNDNAGDAKFFRTALRGVSGSYSDYAILVVSALKGLLPMSREHWVSIKSLRIPMIIIITKIDAVPQTDSEKKSTGNKLLKDVQDQIYKYARRHNQRTFAIRNRNDVETIMASDPFFSKLIPIIGISLKEPGINLELLHHFLSNLKASSHGVWYQPIVTKSIGENQEEKHLLYIDQTFYVKGIDVIVSGVMLSGSMKAGDRVRIGPFFGKSIETNNEEMKFHPLEHAYNFVTVDIKSVHQHCIEIFDPIVQSMSCAMAIKPAFVKKHKVTRTMIRPGMLLLDIKTSTESSSVFFAKVNVLHHATTIKVGFQAVAQIGSIRQTVTFLKIQKENVSGTTDETDSNNNNNNIIRSNDVATVCLRFNRHAEYIIDGQHFVLREGSGSEQNIGEGSMKCEGIITQAHLNYEELDTISNLLDNNMKVKSGLLSKKDLRKENFVK